MSYVGLFEPLSRFIHLEPGYSLKGFYHIFLSSKFTTVLSPNYVFPIPDKFVKPEFSKIFSYEV